MDDLRYKYLAEFVSYLEIMNKYLGKLVDAGMEVVEIGVDITKIDDRCKRTLIDVVVRFMDDLRYKYLAEFVSYLEIMNKCLGKLADAGMEMEVRTVDITKIDDRCKRTWTDVVVRFQVYQCP